MEVNNIIIHSIEKEQRVPEAHLRPSSHLLSVDNRINFLVERLNNAFKKDDRVVKCNFQTEQRAYQSSIRAYASGNFSDQLFLDHSLDSIARMRDLLITNILASGGYFVFIDYEVSGVRWVGVFLVRDSNEVTFSMNDSEEDFIVKFTKIVKTEKLAMACRIDISKLQGGVERYLHFTHRQGTESEYFIEWVEADIADKSRDDSRTLLQIINDIDRPIDPETESVYDENKFRQDVYDYIKGSGKMVNVFSLAERFWGEREKISEFMEENDLTMNNEFRVVSSVIGQLKKYTVSTGRIKLDFSKKDFSDGTVRVGDSDQVIIESVELSEQIRNLDI